MKILMVLNLLLLPLYLAAQMQQVQIKLYATTEKEMYHIYEQLLDSTLANKTMTYGIINSINSKDTLMRIEQYCNWENSSPKSLICEPNRYIVYMSNSLSISIYERFLNYLMEMGKSNNNFYKHFSTIPLDHIRASLIKYYESNKLSEPENKKVLKLIEQVTLRIICEGYNFYFLYGKPNYINDNIRKALISSIEHPFYPECFLIFYKKNVIDSICLDTVSIPKTTISKIEKAGYYLDKLNKNELLLYGDRLHYFCHFKKIGDKLGISPGQAYLNAKINEYPYQGYLDINIIVDYVVKRKDNILIPYLENFQKKHPKYQIKPLK